jgi:hypothetical protein
MTFSKSFFAGQFDAIYRAIDTEYAFHDEDYQRKPWLMANYGIRNWNNFHLPLPDVEE